MQTYFLRYLPSVGFWAFWACPLGHVKITPVSENLRRDFSFSFLCKLFRKGPFRSISCTADFGRLVPPPFRGYGRGSLPCPPGLGFWPPKASWIRFWRLGLPQEGPLGLEWGFLGASCLLTFSNSSARRLINTKSSTRGVVIANNICFEFLRCLSFLRLLVLLCLVRFPRCYLL